MTTKTTAYTARIDTAWRERGWNGRTPALAGQPKAGINKGITPAQYAARVAVLLEGRGFPEACQWAGLNRQPLLECFAQGDAPEHIAQFAAMKLRAAA